MSKPVRVRFAPSPTGPLHMGGVRTALFNYLFAKKHGGSMILRIEDTDQTRFVPGAEEYIMTSLAWCGIKFDEGIREGGPYGPYKQSERNEIYKTYADQLINSGNAYYAFDTPEQLEGYRTKAEADKTTFAYDVHTRESLNNSLSLPQDEVKRKIESGEPYVVRFKMPADRSLLMKDLIRGEVNVNTNTLDDKVLFKSDGLPTYHLANVVDDHEMKISHVIRGEEWLPSMPLHVLLYESLGWKDEMPQFAHLPLILKPTGKGKLSKRDGDQGGFPVFPFQWTSPQGEVSSGYKEEGYFPEAFINMLALLGWNPGTDQEILSMEELISLFSLEKVGKSGSRFDPEKAKWFNQQYLKLKPDEELAEMYIPVVEQKGHQITKEMALRIVGLVKERAVFSTDLWDQSSYFFEIPESYDEKVAKKRWKDGVTESIKEIRDLLANENDFASTSIEEKVKGMITEKEWNPGQIFNCLRLALVGGSFGIHLFDIMEIIGKVETIRRLDKALTVIPGSL